MGKADTIRMKDVAERAGVSVMTVSLVLRVALLVIASQMKLVGEF